MKIKIDEKAVVPITWVFAGFGIIVSITITGAFWVSMVDFRLERIEQKLGIPGARSSFINLGVDAFAREKEKR